MSLEIEDEKNTASASDTASVSDTANASDTTSASDTAGGAHKDEGSPAVMKSDKDHKNGKKKKKKTAGRYAAEFFIKVGVTVLAIWILLSFVLGIYVIHDNLAYPMLKDGDLCIILRPAELHTGDAVVYTSGGKTRFGRIVGMPGETVDIGDDGLTVNGYNVYEDTVYPTSAEGAAIEFPYEVPKGSYFILNDYRPDINDSRIFGAVSGKKVKGRIIFVMRRRGI